MSTCPRTFVPTPRPVATQPPAPTAVLSATDALAARPVATQVPVAQPVTFQSLVSAAANLSGGPGAIYIGDLNQLVGPAPTFELGNSNGNVPLDSLQRHRYIYNSSYYRSLLDKANLTNPTAMVSQGEGIEIPFTCLNRFLQSCLVIENFFAPNLLGRTNGQVKLVATELGLAGKDTLSLVADGTLAMAHVHTNYISGELPELEIPTLPGLFDTRQAQFDVATAVTPELEQIVQESTGGVVVNHNWLAGGDQFFFTKTPIRDSADFKGLKTRSFSAAYVDWINGMGAEAQFVPFAEV